MDQEKKNSLNPTLEAIKELKAEYFIGSLNAYYYLKARNYLEQLRAKIIERTPALGDGLTTRQVEWVCIALPWLLSRKLCVIACTVSTPTNWSCLGNHVVCMGPKYQNPDAFSWRNVVKREKSWAEHDDTWELGEEHVSNFFEFLARMPEQTLGAEALDAYLTWALHAETLHLAWIRSSETFTIADFIQYCRTRNDITKSAVGSAATVMVSDSDSLTEAQRTSLQAALESGNFSSKHHRIILEWEIAYHMDLIELASPKPPGAEDTLELDEWLYDKQLYERALGDFTLGRRDIERQLAINAAHRYQGHVESSDATEFVSTLLQYLRDSLQRMQQQAKTLRDLDAPQAINQGAQKSCDERRYVYLAVLQNRNWLIDFLSH